MADERKPAYYAILPAKVRYDESLRPNAKLLYAEITALATSEGYCWAENATLAKYFGVSPKTVSDLISTLAKRGYVTVKVFRDPKTNEVTKRQIWVEKPTAEMLTPPPKNRDTHPTEADIQAGKELTPPPKNGDTPMEKNEVTPPPKNGEYINKSSLTSIPPKAPQVGRRTGREPKKEPDWKPERFKRFWDFYSHKARGESRQAAIRAWDKLRPDEALIDEMAAALSRQVESKAWQEGIGIPYASTWLNNRRWEDPTPADRPPDSGGTVRVVERGDIPIW